MIRHHHHFNCVFHSAGIILERPRHLQEVNPAKKTAFLTSSNQVKVARHFKVGLYNIEENYIIEFMMGILLQKSCFMAMIMPD